MTEHALRLFDDDGAPIAVASYAPFLRELLDLLVDACQQATRLRIEGRSVAPGMVPAWLEHAAAFEVLRLQQSEVVLGAGPLGERLSSKSGQNRPVSEIDPARSSLDLLEESLEDALQGRMDSDRYDRHLIATLDTRLGRLYRHGVGRMDLVNGRTLRVDQPGLKAIKRLRAQTPEDRRVMVAGKLETIRHSDRAFTLILPSGEALGGVATEDVEPSALAALFGQPALVSGVAKFRPSGQVLRLEAERIGPASGGDLAVFSATPRPLDMPLDTYKLRVPQGPRSGVAAILGQLHTDETEEEFLAALEELS